MQTNQLIKPIDQCSNDELMERLRTVRHSREVARPVAKAKAAKVEKKTSRVKMSAMDKLLDGMSDEEKQKLLAQLTGEA